MRRPKIQASLAAAALLVAASPRAASQDAPIQDAGGQSGELATWTLRSAAADSLGSVEARDATTAASKALRALADRGYVYARVDSASASRVYVTLGLPAQVEAVEVVGASTLADLAAGWSTREGAPFDAIRLAEDLDAAAERYLAEGFPDVELVPSVEAGGDGVRVRVEVTEGLRARLAGVEVTGGRSPSRALVTRLAGLRAGAPFRPVDARALRRELEASGLYESVGEPVLARDGEGRLVVQVPVEDGPPGTFDLVLGYLPPAEGPGGVVGSGRLQLRNPFGGGRRVDVALDRTPGLVSAFDLAVSDPFAAGLPLRLTGVFSGYARDSTFSRQRLRGEAATRVAPGLEVSLSLAREAVSPGPFGADTLGGRPRVQRSAALFAGAGLAFRALDAPLNPRRGLVLDVAAEQGRRRRAADPGRGVEASSALQRRLALRARGYIPTFARQTTVLGADAGLVLTGRDEGGVAAQYDEGELIRFGGATSLRGYDEDAFLGSVVARVLAEYRVLLGPRTFAFAFGDLGYADQPALPDRPAVRDVLPGYGAGLQVRTGLGLATVTYALNPDLPAGRGKVHVGLSVGL